MNSGPYGPPGLKPPGVGTDSSTSSNSGTATASYPPPMYPGYGYMTGAYSYPNYYGSTVPGTYPQQYGAYYNPYMQYGAYYSYNYSQYATQPTTTTTYPSNSLANAPGSYTSSNTTQSSSIYAPGTKSTSSATTVGGAYSNPFASYNSTALQNPSTTAPQKKRKSRFDLTAEKPTTPASLPTVPAKVESISKPVEDKPKTSNLNSTMLKEAYQRKPGKSVFSAPTKRSRSRSNSHSSHSSYSSYSSYSSSSSEETKQIPRKTKGKKKRTKKAKAEILATLKPTEGQSAEELEKRRKRFQPSETPTVTARISTEPEPSLAKEFVGTMMTMEKEYFRLTCIPTPDMIRPKHVLMKWLGILRKRMNNREITYEYYSNQLRAIRQDLTVQHIQDEFTVQVYEEHARFALQNDDMNEFNRCQTQLKELYTHSFKNAHVVEFTCYQLLYCVFSQQDIDFNTFLHSISSQYLTHDKVRKVIQICLAIRSEDYHTFFHYYEEENLPYQCKHFMTQFFRRMRSFALYSLFASVKPSISLELLKRMLHYETYEDAIEGLKDYGLVFQVNKGEKLTDEVCRNVTIMVNDGITAMRNHQHSEKGTKLL